MVEVVTVTLESRTVFWEDIGISASDVDKLRTSNAFAERVWGVMETWLKANTKFTWNAYAKGVWFSCGQDAALFKLFMSGETWT